jgi:hypothetical protein
MQVRRGQEWVPVDTRLVKTRHGLPAFPSAGTSSSRGHKLKAKLATSADPESTVDVNPGCTTQVDIAVIPSGDPDELPDRGRGFRARQAN